jgi:hypothetical protein
MKKELGRVVGLAVTWAVIWAIPGMAIEAIDNVLPSLVPFASRIDMWPQTLALPGFLGGLLFAAFLTVAERRRGFEELSLVRVCLWGALVGLLLSGIAYAVDYFTTAAVPWLLVLSAAASVGSVLFFRLIGRWRVSAAARP